MKRIIIIAFLSISAILNAQLFGWGNKKVKDNGIITEKIRNVEHFTAIKNEGFLDVELSKQDPYHIQIIASENIIPYIITEVKNRTLVVKLKENYKYNLKHKIKIVIGVEELDRLTIKGSGNITGNSLRSRNLTCEIEGSGDLNLTKLHLNHLNASIKGSGDMRLDGKTNSLDIEIKGSGDVRAKKLVSDDVKVQIIGSGDAEVYAKKNIVAKISGSGDIKVKGNPKEKKTSISGSGEVRF